MRSKLNVIKIIVAVISFLILLNLCFGAYLANKTYNVYRKTESVEQYVKNSFIDEKQYVKLSPYMSDVYNSDGTIKENVTNINCDTKYYILYPFVAINEGQLVINAYTGVAEPRFRRVVSHPSGKSEPALRAMSQGRCECVSLKLS